MKIKEEMIEEFKKYLEEFDNYDKELEDIENKQNEHKEKVEKFNEKWGEDIFPSDKPIKEKEEEELKEEEKNIKDEKEKTNKELEAKVNELKNTKINEWIQKIENRRVELDEDNKNKDKYKEQKIRLEKELQNQEEGILIWKKEGINPDDVLYKRRKEVLIPNLKSQIKDCESKLDDAARKEEYIRLGELKEKLKPMQKWSRETVTKNLKELFELDKSNQTPTQTPTPAQTPTQTPTPAQTPAPTQTPTQTPTSTQQVPTKRKIEQNTDKLIIGRKIELKDEIGNSYSIGDTKKYFRKYEERGRIGTIARKIKKFVSHPIEYASNKKYREIPDVYADLAEKLNIEMINEELLKSINLNPVLAYAFEEGLKRGTLHSKDVLNAISAVSSNDKKALGVALPIEWDKTDMSKGAFLPWVRKDRDKLAEFADKSADLMEVTGEYQSSLIKKAFGKFLPAKKEPAQLPEGNGKTINSKIKEFNERIRVIEQQEQSNGQTQTKTQTQSQAQTQSKAQTQSQVQTQAKAQTQSQVQTQANTQTKGGDDR